VAKRSLFAILCELPWWVSLLAAGCIYVIGAAFMPIVGAAAAAPFVGVAVYVAWLRIKKGPEIDVPAVLNALRSASPDDMRMLLTDAFSAEGYEATGLSSGDLQLERNGYVTLVRYGRWRAQSTGGAALKEFADALRAKKADHGIYVTAGSAADDARKRAAESEITLIDGAALAAKVGRAKLTRKLIEKASANAK
jgi:hypothetical protein